MSGYRKLIGLGIACGALVSVAWSDAPERVELCDRIIWAFVAFCGANAAVHKFRDEPGNGVANGQTTSKTP